MSPDIKDLVQTSNNVARILLKEGSYTIQCLTRSAVDSEKMDLAQSIQSTFELIGAKVSFAGGYPELGTGTGFFHRQIDAQLVQRSL